MVSYRPHAYQAVTKQAESRPTMLEYAGINRHTNLPNRPTIRPRSMRLDLGSLKEEDQSSIPSHAPTPFFDEKPLSNFLEFGLREILARSPDIFALVGQDNTLGWSIREQQLTE